MNPREAPSFTFDRYKRLNAWLEVCPNGTILLKTAKVELGQGILIALRQIVAEELHLSVDHIGVLSGDTQSSPLEAGTVGSLSIETSGMKFRRLAAELHHRLIEAASMRLQAMRSTISSQDGVFHRDGQATEETFWTVVAELDLESPFNDEMEPRPPAQYRIVGSSIPKDATNALKGGAFIHDLSFEGLAYGRVIRKPHLEAKLQVVKNIENVASMPGVIRVVHESDLVGLIAADEHTLNLAAARLESYCNWSLEQGFQEGDGPLDLLRRLQSLDSVMTSDQPPISVDDSFLRATYTRPLTAHGSIGPSCGVAIVHEDRADIWTHSQDVFALRGQIARVLSLPTDYVHVRHVPGAGCYGHNGADDAAMDAVMLARNVRGTPIRVQWTRKDELTSEPFGSPMQIDVAAKLSDAKIVAWTLTSRSGTHIGRPGWKDNVNLLAPAAASSQWAMRKALDLPLRNGGSKNAIALYDFAQHVTYQFVPDLPFRLSALRSLGAFANVFAVESFMDELAEAAGVDPIAFRMAHLSDRRAQRVIERVAERSNWSRDMAESTGRGIGFARFKNEGSYCAVVAVVEVTEQVNLRELWACVDAGLPINPEGIRAQIEGGMLQAASWTLKEEVPTRGSLPTAESWKDYPILHFAEVPTVDVDVIEAVEEAPTGVGEASLGPTAGAIGNAVAHALGIRLRALPLTRDRVIEAMMAA
jgi:CO/xanthine dehydrogenase Mo-binding subunit